MDLVLPYAAAHLEGNVTRGADASGSPTLKATVYVNPDQLNSGVATLDFRYGKADTWDSATIRPPGGPKIGSDPVAQISYDAAGGQHWSFEAPDTVGASEQAAFGVRMPPSDEDYLQSYGQNFPVK